MRALAYDSFGGPVTVRDLPRPAAPPGGAVVRVAATGLCRSDWHGWQGHDADIVGFPHVPGHEFAGDVTEVGDGVDPALVGRRVTAPFVQGCGGCRGCLAGDGQVCPHQTQPGFSHAGSMAEYVVVHAAETNLVTLPDELSYDAAAGLGCRVATAWRAVTARAEVHEGQQVVVLGCGGVGLAAIAIAHAHRARVIAVDTSDDALRRASDVGASVCLTGGEDLVERLIDTTDGGAHVTLDCLGSPQTCRDGVLALRPRGRHVQVGLLPDGADVPLGRVIALELDVLGSHGMPPGDYPAMLAAVADGRLDLTALLSPEPALTLDRAGPALEAMGDAASTGIRVIHPG